MNNSHFVYIIRGGDSLYKIGFSSNLENRMLAIKSSNPMAEMVMVFVGGARLEKRIHTLLFEHRVRGEWFSLTASNLAMTQAFVYSKFPDLAIDSLRQMSDKICFSINNPIRSSETRIKALSDMNPDEFGISKDEREELYCYVPSLRDYKMAADVKRCKSDGMTMAEIAECLGVSLSLVKHYSAALSRSVSKRRSEDLNEQAGESNT